VALTELSCAECGAPMKMGQASRRVLRCGYCGRAHVFAAPPKAPVGHDYPAGSPVVVHWGGRWWNAQVVSVLGADQWQIHYEGWSSDWDEAVGPDRIRARGQTPVRSGCRKMALVVGALIALSMGCAIYWVFTAEMPPPQEPTGRRLEPGLQLGVGQPVQVEWNGSWYAATIRAVHPNGRLRVHYEGWSDSSDEDVERDRVLALPGGDQEVLPSGSPVRADTPLVAGQPVQIEWLGSWYTGSILAVHPDGRVRVHYVGWADTYDEDLDRARLQLP